MNAQGLRPAAEYVRVSTDLQKYSAENQMAAIRSYAECYGYEIVRSYVDIDRTGLTALGRDGLARLLADVESDHCPYESILVYDISRWGRFQDIDEAAHYEFRCRRSGVHLHYCAETFINDGTMSSLVLKSLKRIMAAEYSRELSCKVTEAMRAMVRRGFWTGSSPGYGLRRMLVSSDGTPKQVLEKYQQKNIKSDHVILVRGPVSEIRIVRDIYRMFIHEKKSAGRIAEALNNRGILRGDTPWNYQSVLKILKDEKYTGSLVWGRWTQKLHTRCVSVPKANWTIVPSKIKPIVDRRTFEKAQHVRLETVAIRSDEQLLASVRRLLRAKGRLSPTLLNESRVTPCVQYCRKRFGSLQRLYALAGFTKNCRIKLIKKTRLQVTKLHQQVFRKLRKIYGRRLRILRSVGSRPNILRFDTGQKVRIVVCLAVRTSRGDIRWKFPSASVRGAAIITLLCRCSPSNTGIRDFHLLSNTSHLPAAAIMRDDDPRMRGVQRVRSLSQLKDLTTREALASGPELWLDGWDEIGEFLGKSQSTLRRWYSWGLPAVKEGHSIGANASDVVQWLKVRAKAERVNGKHILHLRASLRRARKTWPSI